MEILFDKNLPDFDPKSTLVWAHNLMPVQGRLIPFQNTTDFSNAIPSTAVTGKVISVGDGVSKSFAGNIDNPVLFNSLIVHYTIGGTVYQGTDDGIGNIRGTNISSGTIDYASGNWSITFSVAPDNGVNITADYSYSSLPMILFNVSSEDRSNTTFICGNNKVFRLDGATLTDVTRYNTTPGDNNYVTSLENNWSYDSYGNSLYISNYNDDIQVLNPITSGTKFTQLSATAPKAKVIAMYKDFLFAGNTIESNVKYPRRLRRSVQGNPADWTGTGSGFYDLPSFGDEIVALKQLSDYLVVYLRNSIYLVSFVGDPIWFTYEKVITGAGALSQYSVVRLDVNTHVFLGENDIYIFRGSDLQSIGAGIRKTILSDINYVYEDRITSLVNYENKIIIWAYPSTSSMSGVPDKLIIFNYEEGKFTTADCDVYCLNRILFPSYTIDSLDNISSTIAGLPYPLDSSYYLGGMETMGGVSKNSLKLCIFNGSPKTAYIETGEIRFEDISMIKSVKPIVEKPSGNIQCSLKYRLNFNEDFNETPYFSMSSYGIAGLRAVGRGIKFQLKIDGLHDGIYGIQYDAVSRGKRW